MLNENRASSSSGGIGSVIIASTVSSSNGIPKAALREHAQCRSMPGGDAPAPVAISVTVRPAAPV